MCEVATKTQNTALNETQKAVLSGLSTQQKTLEPKYFYDQLGSQLFEKITKTPEYYPTRTERSILSKNAHAIAKACGKDNIVIEPGCGSCEKIRLLLNELHPSLYVPMDISGEFLAASAARLAQEYPWLKIQPVTDDFSHGRIIPMDLPSGQRTVFYPGSTIGNMTPHQAKKFLTELRQELAVGDALLLGVDLIKSEAVLNAAYNDKEGVTEQFNLNILNHINALTGSDFLVENFKHYAFYNASLQRIEMHLESLCDHKVRLAGQEIEFSQKETIHTENSYKYSLDSIRAMAEDAGFRCQQSWADEEQLFCVSLLTSVED
ncbi:MAG: L-histidine N(alpha)-methyltransferase [Oleibacter sp.]|nr:L-histidine N(alpha)-methyltransferase [Thalassolituus sp.]